MGQQRSHWVDCTQPFRKGMPKMSFLPEPKFEELIALGEYSPKVSMLQVCTHLGTHIDAPSHFIAGGKNIGDFPAQHFIREGVVWKVEAQPCSPIRLEDLPQVDIQDVQRGDAVFLYTGWGEKTQQPEYYDHPFLDEEVAHWLVDKGVSIVGIDFLTPDKPPQLREKGFRSPIHRILLGSEVLIIENLTALSSLAGRRVEIFAPPLYVQEQVEAAPARVLVRPLT